MRRGWIDVLVTHGQAVLSEFVRRLRNDGFYYNKIIDAGVMRGAPEVLVLD
jgi:hypothetical protein